MTNDFKGSEWRGRTHDFGDGTLLRVVDVKWRETGPWVTYETVSPAALPKRFSLKLADFTSQYGHLFQNV
jgi:hypothetical protein